MAELKPKRQGKYHHNGNPKHGLYRDNSASDAKYIPTDSDKSIGLAGGISFKELMESVE